MLIGLGADPAVRDTLPAAGQRMGTLIQTTRNYGTFRTIADLAAWEAANDPVNSRTRTATRWACSSSAVATSSRTPAATRCSGSADGAASGSWPTFPNADGRTPHPSSSLPPGTQIPMQAVPTSVAAKGHDGAYYVSQLTGFPFPKGGANIYRIDPRSGQTTIYASGLTNVTDLAFRGRSLYAVQLATEGLLNGPIGSVVKVKPGATAPADHTLVVGELPSPYGIAIRGGDAYVTTHSTEKDAGEVIRIRL